MNELVDQTVSLPTVIFTVPLIFFLLWFLIGFVVSGFDVGDGDFDLDLDGDGDIDGLESLLGALHLSALGLPLSMLLLSFGGWAVCLLVSSLATDAGFNPTLVVLAGLLLGLAAGFAFVWKVGGSIGKALITEQGALRDSAIGCVCKVRTTRVTPTFGDAEVMSGPMKNSIVRVRADEGLFQRGDVALLVDIDPERDAYWIAEIEEQYRPTD